MQSLPPIKYSYTTHGVVIIICLKATKLTNPPRLLPAYRFAVCLLVCVSSLCQWEDTVFWDHNPCWWHGRKHILFPRYAQAARAASQGGSRTAVMCNSSFFRGQSCGLQVIGWALSTWKYSRSPQLHDSIWYKGLEFSPRAPFSQK